MRDTRYGVAVNTRHIKHTLPTPVASKYLPGRHQRNSRAHSIISSSRSSAGCSRIITTAANSCKSQLSKTTSESEICIDIKIIDHQHNMSRSSNSRHTSMVTGNQQRRQCLLWIGLASSLLLLSTAPTMCAAGQESLKETIGDISADTSGPASSPSPFSFIKQLVLVLPLQALNQPPTPPPAYQNYPNSQWDFLGGRGYFLITRNDFGIFGVLSEAWYLPGLYHPKCSSKNDVYYSAQRLWANMEISRVIGRKVWGFPKESASIEWGPSSVTVKDTTGNTVFSASFSDPLDKPSPTWLTSFANTGLDTIQWPIHDAAAKNGSSTEVQLKSRKQAHADKYIAAHIQPKPLASVTTESGTTPANNLVPNVQHLSFSGSTPGTLIPAPGYKQLKVLTPTQITFDSKAFTGRVGQEVVLADGLDAGLIVGTPGSLNNPVQYNC